MAGKRPKTTRDKIAAAIRARAKGATLEDMQQTIAEQFGAGLSHRATAAMSQHFSYVKPSSRYATCSTATLERHAAEIMSIME